MLVIGAVLGEHVGGHPTPPPETFIWFSVLWTLELENNKFDIMSQTDRVAQTVVSWLVANEEQKNL